MKRLIQFSFTLFAVLLFSSSVATADVAKGQKLYMKQLKAVCNMTGSDFAAKHTQDEWDEIYDAGKLNDEINNICSIQLEEKLLPHIYDFAYEYASDSGNVPSC